MFKEYDEYFSNLRQYTSDATIISYKRCLNNFNNYFGIKNVSDIELLNTSDIQNYLSILASNYIPKNDEERIELEKNLERMIGTNKNQYSEMMKRRRVAKNLDTARGSANQEGTIIKVFINWLENKNYIKENPCNKDLKTFERTEKIADFFDRDERDSILFACKNKLWLQVTIALLFYTGLRAEELVNVKIEDFFVDHLNVQRRGYIQKLYFPVFVGNLIDTYIKKRKDTSEFLLVSIRGQHKITTNSLHERVKEACLMAGLDEERVNTLGSEIIRRSFACILLLEGNSPFAIQQVLGLSNINSVERLVKPAMELMAGRIAVKQTSPEWYKNPISETPDVIMGYYENVNNFEKVRLLNPNNLKVEQKRRVRNEKPIENAIQLSLEIETADSLIMDSAKVEKPRIVIEEKPIEKNGQFILNMETVETLQKESEKVSELLKVDIKDKTLQNNLAPWIILLQRLSVDEKDLLLKISITGSISENDLELYAHSKGQMGNLLLDSIGEKAFELLGRTPFYPMDNLWFIENEDLYELRKNLHGDKVN